MHEILTSKRFLNAEYFYSKGLYEKALPRYQRTFAIAKNKLKSDYQSHDILALLAGKIISTQYERLKTIEFEDIDTMDEFWGEIYQTYLELMSFDEKLASYRKNNFCISKDFMREAYENVAKISEELSDIMLEDNEQTSVQSDKEIYLKASYRWCKKAIEIRTKIGLPIDPALKISLLYNLEQQCTHGENTLRARTQLRIHLQDPNFLPKESLNGGQMLEVLTYRILMDVPSKQQLDAFEKEGAEIIRTLDPEDENDVIAAFNTALVKMRSKIVQPQPVPESYSDKPRVATKAAVKTVYKPNLTEVLPVKAAMKMVSQPEPMVARPPKAAMKTVSQPEPAVAHPAKAAMKSVSATAPTATNTSLGNGGGMFKPFIGFGKSAKSDIESRDKDFTGQSTWVPLKAERYNPFSK